MDALASCPSLPVLAGGGGGAKPHHLFGGNQPDSIIFIEAIEGVKH